MVDEIPHLVKNGRGAVGNPAGRFERFASQPIDDGWQHQKPTLPLREGRNSSTLAEEFRGGVNETNPSPAKTKDLLRKSEFSLPLPQGEREEAFFDPEETDVPKIKTTLHIDTSRSVINYVKSPDMEGMRTINPYRGCEHGCIYCFARPSHSYLGFSPGLDFETEIFYKPDAPEILRRELAAKKYEPSPITLGSNTDCYQPVERTVKLTRRLVEVLAEHKHPLVIITKSALVARDIDLLAPMAEQNLARVLVSVTTLDPALARVMEPRAAAPYRRLATIKALTDAGIPVTVMTAPMIPALNDMEMERILEAAWDAGARTAHYTLVRLPYELKELFDEWLRAHRPDRAEHVLSLIRQTRGGKLYDADFSQRRIGTGAFADLLADRFHLACKRIGLNQRNRTADDGDLRTDLFRKPESNGQMGFEFG